MSTATKNPPVKAQARGLGKGLSALMSESYSPRVERTPEPKTAQAAPVAVVEADGAALEVALEDIRPGKYQPRDHFDQRALIELSESIRRNGVVQPILLRKGADGKYEIIAGERRWRGAGMAGLRTIPAIIRDLSDRKVMEIALVENVQREDLNPLEEAGGYQRLLREYNYTQEELAGTVNKSRSHIANLLRLLDLPEDIRHLLAENKLTMGHARALFGVPNAAELAEEIVHKGLSVRQAEKMARLGKRGTDEVRPRKSRLKEVAYVPAAPVPVMAPAPLPLPVAPQPAMVENPYRDPDILALEETLSENLGLKVSINDRGQSGQITISYSSLDQLDDILRRLGGSI
jgi:ParB family chromosome partitioning protein